MALASGRSDLSYWLEWRGWSLPGRRLLPGDLPAAAISGDAEAVVRLLDLGLPVDAVDPQGCTALLRAAGGGHEGIVGYLLERGADPGLSARTGATPLSAAISMRHARIVDVLLQAGADPDQSLPGEVTPLMLAAALGLPEIAGRLLNKGATVRACDAQGLTALHCAALHGFTARDRSRLLALFATGMGLYYQTPGAPYQYTNHRNETVMINGHGLYFYDTVSTVAQMQANDLITLMVGLPLLIVSAWLAFKGSLRGQLLLTGTLGFFLYTYMSMSMLTAYNALTFVEGLTLANKTA